MDCRRRGGTWRWWSSCNERRSGERTRSVSDHASLPARPPDTDQTRNLPQAAIEPDTARSASVVVLDVVKDSLFPALIVCIVVDILTSPRIAISMASGWKSLQSGFASLNLGQSANKLAKGLSSSVQATKERLGQVAPDEITELPQGMSLLGVLFQAHRTFESSDVTSTQNTETSRLVLMPSVLRTSRF